jgi:hypothetical protein
MSYYAPYKGFIQSLFLEPIPEVTDRMKPVLDALRSTRHTTLVGLHMRRGDTGRAIFYLTPNEWYRTWLEEHWDRLHNPVLFVASEEPGDVEDFRDFDAVSMTDLLDLSLERYPLYNYLKHDLRDPTPGAMDWFPDWYVLQHCDVLLFGESTFSFSAAMTSISLQEAWRSRLSIQGFERIDVWDSDTLCREHMDEYPRVEGTYYTDNPKWRGGEVSPS